MVFEFGVALSAMVVSEFEDGALELVQVFESFVRLWLKGQFVAFGVGGKEVEGELPLGEVSLGDKGHLEVFLVELERGLGVLNSEHSLLVGEAIGWL